eukprot:TRINITY_DN25520_c0_g1_i1.p1 TRINITY_DN25520_c0_g1~~TRINITY_DN25520_c0_g1_i1.p1  ORF type:complete len:259 (+),score=27.36 TRINITY_DN25520_c0_g1_i1:222-998(+)
MPIFCLAKKNVVSPSATVEAEEDLNTRRNAVLTEYENPTGWSIYINKAYAIEVSAPVSWNRRVTDTLSESVGPQGDRQSQLSVMFGQWMDLPPYVEIMVQINMPEDLTPESYASISKSHLAEQGLNFTDSLEECTMMDKPAHVLIIDSTSKDAPFRLLSRFLIEEGTVFVANYMSLLSEGPNPFDEYERFLPIANEIIDSFNELHPDVREGSHVASTPQQSQSPLVATPLRHHENEPLRKQSPPPKEEQVGCWPFKKR